MKKPFAAVIIILHFMPALFAQVTINANLTATAGQNQITAYSINKNLIIDGCAGVSVPQYVCNSTGINAAYSALVSAGGGTLYIPASTVTISSTVTFTSPTVQVVGAGSSATIFNCTVNGDCINTRTNPFTIGPGTVLEGITLVGQGSSTPNAVGIHTGDMVGGRFSDIQIDNFTGTNSSCFWVDNQHGWFERNYISNLELGMHGPGSNEDGCTKELRLTNSDSSDGNSFGYNTWIGLRFASEGNSQTWISYESGNVYSNFIQASGNLGNVSSTSATLFSVQGTSDGDNNFITIEAECNSCASAFTRWSIAGGATLGFYGPGIYTNGTSFVDSISGTLNPRYSSAYGQRTNSAGAVDAMFPSIPSGSSTPQLNELLPFGDGYAGIGHSFGNNISHPFVWGYSGDTNCFEVYKKNYGTAVATGGLIAQLSCSGNYALNGHLNQFTTKQFAGTCTMSGTSCTFTLAGPFTNPPVCVATVHKG